MSCTTCSLYPECVWSSDRCISNTENEPWWIKASLCKEHFPNCPQDNYYVINHIPEDTLDFEFSGINRELPQGLFCKWSIINPPKSFIRIAITRQSVNRQVTLG